MFCGIDSIPPDILRGILTIPENIVMDMNNVIEFFLDKII